jgi:hypothetical protein
MECLCDQSLLTLFRDHPSSVLLPAQPCSDSPATPVLPPVQWRRLCSRIAPAGCCARPMRPSVRNHAAARLPTGAPVPLSRQCVALPASACAASLSSFCGFPGTCRRALITLVRAESKHPAQHLPPRRHRRHPPFRLLRLLPPTCLLAAAAALRCSANPPIDTCAMPAEQTDTDRKPTVPQPPAQSSRDEPQVRAAAPPPTAATAVWDGGCVCRTCAADLRCLLSAVDICAGAGGGIQNIRLAGIQRALRCEHCPQPQQPACGTCASPSCRQTHCRVRCC